MTNQVFEIILNDNVNLNVCQRIHKQWQSEESPV
jgi:hypothetical protein